MSEIKQAIEQLEQLEQQIKDLQDSKAEYMEYLKSRGLNTNAIKMAVKFKMMDDNQREQFKHDWNCTSDYLEEVNVQLALFPNPIIKAVSDFHKGLAENGMEVENAEGNVIHIRSKAQ